MDGAPNSQHGDNRRGATHLAVALALVAAFAAFQTFSFVVRSTRADNVVTFGGVSIALEETMLDGSGGEVPVPDGPETISAGRDCSRIVRVRNVGRHPAYVRVRMDMTGAPAQGEASSANDITSYRFSADADAGAWVQRDGWYYYGAPLGPGQTTPALIEGLYVDTHAASQRYAGGELTLDIDASAVQCENNAASAVDAEGWPEGDE